MGNYCCKNETCPEKKLDEHHFDTGENRPITLNELMQSRLDTVKEELNENTEQSDIRSLKHSSPYNT